MPPNGQLKQEYREYPCCLFGYSLTEWRNGHISPAFQKAAMVFWPLHVQTSRPDFSHSKQQCQSSAPGLCTPQTFSHPVLPVTRESWWKSDLGPTTFQLQGLEKALLLFLQVEKKCWWSIDLSISKGLQHGSFHKKKTFCCSVLYKSINPLTAPHPPWGTIQRTVPSRRWKIRSSRWVILNPGPEEPHSGVLPRSNSSNLTSQWSNKPGLGWTGRVRERNVPEPGLRNCSGINKKESICCIHTRVKWVLTKAPQGT